jgi:hypothetical protein
MPNSAAVREHHPRRFDSALSVARHKRSVALVFGRG